MLNDQGDLMWTLTTEGAEGSNQEYASVSLGREGEIFAGGMNDRTTAGAGRQAIVSLLGTASLITAIFGLYFHYTWNTFPRPPFDAADQFISSQQQARDQVVHANKLTMLPMVYYNRTLAQSYVRDTPGLRSSLDTLQGADTSVPTFDRVCRDLRQTVAQFNLSINDRTAVFWAAFVQVFGRRHDGTMHALRRPASEKRQGTKSREVSGGGAAGSGCRGRYGDLSAGSGSKDIRSRRIAAVVLAGGTGVVGG
jgi:hypothetical protein